MAHLNRRALVTGVAFTALAASRVSRAQSSVEGRIAYIVHGNIMEWTRDGIVELKSDGAAMAPTWRPGSDMLMYVRDGESFSNLISLDTLSGRTRRLTNSESDLQKGSADYVASSVWIVDPYWSDSGIVVFSSTADDPYGQLQLWVLRFDSDTLFPALHDGLEYGKVTKATVDDSGRYAAYTVTGEDMMSAYIGLRNLDTGETGVVMEGARGAYDGAISPDSNWVAGIIRDSDNRNDIWIVGVGDTAATRLTEGEEASNVTWDPSGEWLAYLAFVGSGFSLRAFRLDLSGDTPRIDGDIEVLIENEEIDSTSRISWTWFVND